MTSASQHNTDPPVEDCRSDDGKCSCSAIPVKLAVSLVIPAYNERDRLPPYLDAIREHFDHDLAGSYEVIVVDDGGSDGLADDLTRRAGEFPQLRVIRHEKNRGKGAAVRSGMMEAQGRFVLFADADGATPIEEESRLRAELRSGADIAIGSRRVLGAGVERNRSPLRNLVGKSFAGLARWLLGLAIRDTQCGFKMFRREAAAHLFPQLREEGYYFDLELLILASRCGYRVKEVPINWADQPGSRMSLVRELGRMFGAFRRLRKLAKKSETNSKHENRA